MINTPLFSGFIAVAILLAFVFGYLFALRQYQLDTAMIQNTPKYVDISTNTRSITIRKAPENIFFRVNGEIFHTGSVSLK